MAFLAQLGRTGAKRLAPRALCQTEQLRFYAAQPAAVADDDDIVLSSFRKQQRQYQSMMQGLQNITIPLTGDDAAVKKYSAEVEALKKKLGMPDYEDVINAELDYSFACAGRNVRKFVGSVVEEMHLDGGSVEGAGAEVAAAVAEAEAASGRELDAANDKGWALLAARMAEIEKKYGLSDKAAVREEAVHDMYRKHIASLREAVEGDVDKARRADNLEHIQPNLAGLKPKLS